MSNTEDDLRTLLEERGAGSGSGAGGGVGSTDRLEAILARGRAIRRRRTAAAAAAVLTAGALAVAVVVPSLTGRGGGEAPIVAVAADPTPVPTAVPPVSGKDLPATVNDLMNRHEMRLIYAYRSNTLGVKRTLTFTPTSVFTGFRVVCEDPRAVVVKVTGAGKHRSGSAGECGSGRPGLTSQHGKESVPPGWTSREQSATVWVLPPRPRISREALKKLKCPEKEVERTGMCRGHYMIWALIGPRMDTRVLERVMAKVGSKPGRWAIGVYDRPSS
ncbi:hypothetical protein AB0G15_35855 [Streptosporangium sp. NPDC023825]|uniref:hypothetical protein n=1 Tax=Streptosporangium sp. NPDC023825 TaxID=3154909 RepID=UPI00344762CD